MVVPRSRVQDFFFQKGNNIFDDSAEQRSANHYRPPMIGHPDSADTNRNRPYSVNEVERSGDRPVRPYELMPAE